MLCVSVKWPKPKKFVKTVHGKAFNMPGNIKKYFGLSLRLVLTVILVVLLAGAIYKLMKKEVGSRRFTEKVPSSSFPRLKDISTPDFSSFNPKLQPKSFQPQTLQP